MCNPALALMGAGTTMSVIGQLNAGKAQQQASNEQASLDRHQAATATDDALAQATMIRKAQRGAIGTADTQAAASGVVVGQGSSQEAEREIYNDSEHDAYMAILSGNRRARALQTEAAFSEASGHNAVQSSQYAALGTVLGGGAKGYSGWATMGGGG